MFRAMGIIQLSSLEVQICLQLADPSSRLGDSGTQELAAGVSSNVVSLVVSHQGAYTEAVGYQAVRTTCIYIKLRTRCCLILSTQLHGCCHASSAS